MGVLSIGPTRLTNQNNMRLVSIRSVSFFLMGFLVEGFSLK